MTGWPLLQSLDLFLGEPPDVVGIPTSGVNMTLATCTIYLPLKTTTFQLFGVTWAIIVCKRLTYPGLGVLRGKYMCPLRKQIFQECSLSCSMSIGGRVPPQKRLVDMNPRTLVSTRGPQAKTHARMCHLYLFGEKCP